MFDDDVAYFVQIQEKTPNSCTGCDALRTPFCVAWRGTPMNYVECLGTVLKHIPDDPEHHEKIVGLMLLKGEL